MRKVLTALAVIVASRTASASPKLTLEDTIGKALAGPKARMAASDIESAASRADEADAARLPRVSIKAFATVSPEINCANLDCTKTDPQTFAFDYSGLYGDAELSVTQPLYTFGKIGHARAAAKAGLDAQAALADETAGDLALDAARAYWGVKVARELVGNLDDGIDQITDAVNSFNTSKTATIIDKQRIAVLLAEAKSQRADAAQQLDAALAGLRAITGVPDADVDDSVLEPVTRELPSDAAIIAAAGHRPQTIAAKAGAIAADELADYQHSQLFPDLALIGGAVASDAQGVADPPGAFFNNPYNRYGFGLVLGLQWTLEPWNVSAREGRARADADKAHAQADLAVVGARYDLDGAMAEAKGAQAKLAARDEGQKAARTWLAAVLQAQTIGGAEPRDLADSYIAWFQNRALWSAAVMQWNVAVVRLDRAMGEFHAGGGRPR
nr:TolC family protein [Kofleriaceae bacterium]